MAGSVMLSGMVRRADNVKGFLTVLRFKSKTSHERHSMRNRIIIVMEEPCLTSIGDVMRRCCEREWITTRDGNMSMRKRDGKYFYITPSGCRNTIEQLEHVCEIVLKSGLRVRVMKNRRTSVTA